MAKNKNNWGNMKAVLKKYGIVLEKAAKKSLQTTPGEFGEPHRASGALLNSIAYHILETPNGLRVSLYMNDYGRVLDQGLVGRKANRTNGSPYKAEWTKPGPVTPKFNSSSRIPINSYSIKQWIQRKGIKPRDNISIDSLAYLISRKLVNEGFRGNKWYTKAINSVKKQMMTEIKKATGQDIKETMLQKAITRLKY